MFENTRVYLAAFADDAPTLDNFGVETVTIDAVPDGHLVVKTHTLSVDAWIRTTLSDAGMHSKSPLGQTIRAFGVGEVVASSSPDWQVGDWAYGTLSAQSHALVDASTVKKVHPGDGIEPGAFVGALGITTGLTAWVGLVPVGELADGDTVLVSGAAGAVGSCVVQIAKARGARVIGIAGGPEKCTYLTGETGADVAIDYRAGDVSAQVAEAAPGGIDLFFDNVGGEILDAALANLRPEGGARIAICGAISQYENLDDVRGPKLYLRLAERNATMRGFVVSYHAARFPEAIEEISGLIKAGKLTLREHVVDGVENFPQALLQLYSGGHHGNLVVRA